MISIVPSVRFSALMFLVLHTGKPQKIPTLIHFSYVRYMVKSYSVIFFFKDVIRNVRQIFFSKFPFLSILIKENCSLALLDYNSILCQFFFFKLGTF